MKKIDDGAFDFCKNLEEVVFESDPLYVGNSFYDTKFYNNIKEDEDGCKYIGTHLIEIVDNKKQYIVIKEGTVSIARNAFSLSDIRKVVLSKELKVIGESAFGSCHKLKEIELPEGLLYIDRLCFELCENLNRVYIPKSVEYIGDNIFYLSVNLKEVTVSKDIADKIDFDGHVKVRYIE